MAVEHPSMRTLSILACTLSLSGCGSSSPSTPSAPSAPASTTTTATTTTIAPIAPFLFDYDAAVTIVDRATIEAGFPMCQSYFQSIFGVTTADGIIVSVKADSNSVDQAGGRRISVSTLNDSWLVVGRAQRTKILCHELFHILQDQTSWSRDDTHWFLEGAAEYVGYASIISNGQASYDEVKTCQIDNYFGAGGNSIVPLEQLSFPASRGSYLVGWLALDKLLGGLGGVPTLSRYWQAGAWPQSFTSVFGFRADAFYTDFSQYRTTLRSSGTKSCAGLNSR